MANAGFVQGHIGNRYNYLIVVTIALGSFTYGFNNAIIGSVFGLTGFYSVRLTSADQLPANVSIQVL